MDIEKIVENFSIKPLKTEIYEAGGVNAEHIFKIYTNDEVFLLKSIRNDRIEWAENAANLTNHLLKHGFTKTPKILKTQRGSAIISDEVGTNWSLQQFVESRQIRNTELTLAACESLGKTVAELHTTYLNDTTILEEPYVRKEISYEEMFENEQHEKMVEAMETLRKLEIPKEDKDLVNNYWEEYLKTRKNVLDVLKKINEDNFSKSITHRDLNKGNILFSPNKDEVVAIVDWEEIAYGNIIQDIAYVTSHYLTNIENLEQSKINIQTFIKTYEQQIKLNDQEKLFIPTLVEILLVRATRWWGKRYIQLIEEKATPENIEKHRGGFRKTILNWMQNKDKYINLFEEVFKYN